MCVKYIEVLRENENKYTVRQMDEKCNVVAQDHPVYSECEAKRNAMRLAVARKVKYVGIV